MSCRWHASAVCLVLSVIGTSSFPLALVSGHLRLAAEWRNILLLGGFTLIASAHARLFLTVRCRRCHRKQATIHFGLVYVSLLVFLEAAARSVILTIMMEVCALLQTCGIFR